MLVPDPKETISALCKIKSQTITWNLYKKTYEEEVGRKNDPINRGNADTHFYSLRIFHLITIIKKNEYKASQITFDICDAIENNDKEKYQKILQTALLNSEKGELFQEFLNKFNSEKLTKEKLGKDYKHRILETLIAWSTYSGLIYKRGSYYWKLKIDEKKPSLPEFMKVLKNTYQKMNKTNMFAVRRIYIRIDELCYSVCAHLGIKKELFDKLLTKLINEKRLKIRLHGGPPIYSDEEQTSQTFEYQRKLYHYLSIE